MATTYKTQPNRDLQCYFQTRSSYPYMYGASTGAAALYKCTDTEAHIAGSFTDAFDWSVVEWNRDNIYEHLSQRNVPNGDFTGTTLSYRDSRDANVVQIDSFLFDWQDWGYLRIFTGQNTDPYKVKLTDYAVAGPNQVAASVSFTITPVAGMGRGPYTDAFCLTSMGENYWTTVDPSGSSTDYSDVLHAIATGPGATASLWYNFSVSGNTITLTSKVPGTSGNRLRVTAMQQSGSANWDTIGQKALTGGVNPDYWTITLPFDTILGIPPGGGAKVSVPVTNIRAMRWTHSPEPCIDAPFVKQDYAVHWTNWSMTGGSNAVHRYANNRSVVLDDDDPSVCTFGGFWARDDGNYVGGSIRYGDHSTCTVTVKYNHPETHTLYLGSRTINYGGIISVTVDGGAPVNFDLYIPTGAINDDRLVRFKVGTFGPGPHTVVVANTGNKNSASNGWRTYFDYLQVAVLGDVHDPYDANNQLTLATDWDTDHTRIMPPERTIWNMRNLGFTGPTNHYVGALQWYNLKATGGTMASATVTMSGTPVGGDAISIVVDGFSFTRTFLPGETLATVQSTLADAINGGSTSIRAAVVSGVLTLIARRQSGGALEPNTITISVTTAGGGSVTGTASGSTLSGGVPYYWVTDMTPDPVLNNATVRWLDNYCAVLHNLGMTGVCAFSQELAHEPQTSSLAARFSDGSAVWLNTPALMCNFGTASQDYFKRAYLKVAQVMDANSLQPWLQFGEVQWWYFANKYDYVSGNNVTASSLGLYDSETTSNFTAAYGGSMHVFVDEYNGAAITEAAMLSTYPHESAFLSNRIGQFTDAIRTYVRATLPACKFEVLYPLDVNRGGVTKVINSPSNTYWGASALDSIKTEGFGFFFARNLDQVKTLIDYGYTVRNFDRLQCRVNLGCYSQNDPYERGVMYAESQGIGPNTLWAYDQFSMRSHRAPLYSGDRTFTVT